MSIHRKTLGLCDALGRAVKVVSRGSGSTCSAIAARVRRWRHQRATLGVRLLLVLCTIAGFAIALAFMLQGHSLSGDLRDVASRRLEAAADAVDHLLDKHLDTIAARYHTISGTPQFLANLEVGHGPTLVYFATQLALRHDAAVVVFSDRAGTTVAHSGNEELSAVATEYNRERRPIAESDERDGVVDLLEHVGKAYAIAALPMRAAQNHVGYLTVLERIDGSTLDGWSKLSGVRVWLDESPPSTDVSLTIRRIGELEMNIAVSLDAERDAVSNSRRSLFAAGIAALILAFGASFVVTKGLVKPIRAIRAAAERIAHGDLRFRLDEKRRDEVGDVARAFNCMLDRLQEAQARLTNAQRLARLGNWGYCVETGELDGSPEFRRIYGLPIRVEAFDLETLLERIHPGDREAFRHGIEGCLADGNSLNLDHRCLTLKGSERILHTHVAVARPGVIEGTVQDITARKRIEEQVRYLAYRDSLTGLGNRRLLKERLGLALEQARRAGSSVAVLFLDLDRFKVINDTLGHSAGDKLLLGVADRLVQCAQIYDSEFEDADTRKPSLVIRLGGDEFTVLVTDAGDRIHIEQFARSTLESFSTPFSLNDQDVTVSPSIGIAVFPDDAHNVETLLRVSDTAMYHAKSLGSGRYQFYTDWMHQAARERLLLENRLHRAIEHGEFELFYQPKVNLQSGLITGVEALIRWNDPEHGVIVPDDFIPLAEETGVVLPIGRWVLDAAVRQASAWQEQGLPPVRVAVNISVHQMEDHDEFLSTLTTLLEETGLDPKLLDLEITESTLMKDEESAIALLAKLRGLGIGVSLDDFGTGYSSLSYLRRLPIDTLKIDRSFVSRVDSDPDDAALAAAIIGMARVLGLRVVVEGVETERQRKFLADLGCDEFQGFLHSEPLSAVDVTAMLRENLQTSSRV